MSNQNTSTAQSYLDSAKGAINSAIGSVTGNPGDKRLADQQKAEADVKHDLSHSSARLGGVTATPEGGVAKDDPNRSEGSWNQTIGSAKETLGNLVGHEGLKKDGREQNLQGQGQEAQGQLSDLSKGIANRATGAVGGAIAGLTGSKEAQAGYQQQHDDGKAQQRGAESDIQKQA